ncbi:unnamed protein product, partial [Rotaria socialis]
EQSRRLLVVLSVLKLFAVRISNDGTNADSIDNDDGVVVVDDENPTSSDEIPLDLSMKMDGNQHDMEQTSIKVSNSKQPISTK